MSSHVTPHVLPSNIEDKHVNSFSINTPSRSLPYGLPANMTWTGGIPPYTLLLQQDGRALQDQISGIETTYMVWTPWASVGTKMLLKLVDGLDSTIALEMFFIARDGTGDNDESGAPLLPPSISSQSPSNPSSPPTASPSSLQDPVPHSSSTSSFTSSSSPSSSTSLSTFSSTLNTYSISTTITNNMMVGTSVSNPQVTTVFLSEPPTPTPTVRITISSPESGTLRDAVIGSTVMAAVLVAMILVLWKFPRWRSCIRTKRRDYQKDTETQDMSQGYTRDELESEFATEADIEGSQYKLTKEQLDNPSTTVRNPFESPENVLYNSYMDDIYGASADPNPHRQMSRESPITSIRTTTTVVPTEMRQPTINGSGETLDISRVSYLSTHSASRTFLEPEMANRRISNSTTISSASITGSTLPPSYHSNRSTAYVPLPSYPPLPPPVYTYAQAPHTTNSPPASPFRMSETFISRAGDRAGQRADSFKSSRRRVLG